MLHAKSLINYFSFLFVLIVIPSGVFAATLPENNLEKIFYYSYLKSGVESFKNNAAKIDIFAPQAYEVSSKLKVSGGLSSEIKKIVSDDKIKVMPLIANANFNQKIIHDLLVSKTAQDALIKYLINEIF